MRLCLPIIVALGLVSCEKEQAVTAKPGPSSQEIILQHEGFRSAYTSSLEEQSGIPAELLPPYHYASIQHDGNHEYIYVLGDDSRAQWAILIYSSSNASKQAFEIFKETPTEDGVRRSPITDKELATHLDIIERKLIEHYGEAMYSRYYTGGLPEELETDNVLTGLDTGEEMSLELIEQRAAETLGEETLYNIAHLIHYLRASLNNR